jgi:pimeloyl-ACP methyl ester carboxylesterase
MLEKVHSPPGWDRTTASRLSLGHRQSAPHFGVLYGIDQYNVKEALQGIGSDSKVRHWADLTRRHIFVHIQEKVDEIIEWLEGNNGPPKIRVFIVPGMMGSQLSDRDGHHGLLWVDPVGLAIGSDFPALRLTPDGTEDADSGIRVEAAGPIPLIYDRLAISLMTAFGRSVDYLEYDWRKPINLTAKTVGDRIARKVAEDGDTPIVLVAHSQGGLVAAKALDCLKTQHPEVYSRVKGLVSMGTPWKGSLNGALAMMAQGKTIEQFALMTKWDKRDIANICQTFWGLSDTLPTDNPELLKPEIYSPGPISSSPFAIQQLSSPQNLNATPPPNTLAIVCDLFSTVSNLMRGSRGFEVEEGPGDGTVSLWSATFGGMLESATVSQKHIMLPLDSTAIRKTIEKISEWTALAPNTLYEMGDIDKAITSVPSSRDNFIESLENMDEKPIPLGTLTGMLFLA